VSQYRADILGLLRGVSELLPALAGDLAQLCRPSREAPGAFPAKPGKRYPSPPACHTIHFSNKKILFNSLFGEQPVTAVISRKEKILFSSRFREYDEYIKSLRTSRKQISEVEEKPFTPSSNICPVLEF
jgi:hypothetical protein